MRFSCLFLQIKEVNQKLPQMTFIRLKTQDFRTKKDIWCWYKIANISRLCCYQMSNPTIWRFTADNFNNNMLVAPPFVKRQKLIYTPMYIYHILNSKKRQPAALWCNEPSVCTQIRKGAGLYSSKYIYYKKLVGNKVFYIIQYYN